MSVKITIVGAGRIGNVHLGNVLANRRIKVVAVVDSVPENASAMAAAVGCKAYGSLTDALKAEETDGIMVLSPTHTHVDYIKEGLNAEKHVFTEKPIGGSITVVYELYELAKKVNRHLLVGFQRRFDPTFYKLKQELDAGRIGTLHKVKTISRDNPPPSKEYLKISGGIVHDCAVHDIDLVRWLTGDSPISVVGVGSAFSQDVKDCDDVDVVELIFKFKSGVIATCDVARLAVYGYDQRIECLGDKGVLRAENPPITTLQIGNADGFHSCANKYSFPERYKEAYYNEVDHFLDLIEGKIDTPRVSVTDVAHVQKMLDCAAEAVKTGKIVEITY